MIAVTGANGLLGSYIARELIQQKQEFIAFKRADSDTSLLADVSHLIEWRNVDMIDPVSLEENVKGISAVIHAAAMVSFSRKKKDQLYAVNVLGTRNVVNACLLNGVKKLVHISSVAALGRQKDQTILDENHK